MIGKELSHFRIVSKIGEGGMGVVYRAEDNRLRRPVALKILRPELMGDEERRQRFLHEARAAAAVTHPNIAAVYEVGEENGVVFMAMELVQGRTLRFLLGADRLSIGEALRIGAKIAAGLAQAHQAGVIHRDLKPDNIMIGPESSVKILDFGLAKVLKCYRDARDPDASQADTLSGVATRAGQVMGTAAYMSPEQTRGEPLDQRSDIFALGIVLYELVTGRTPFRGRTNIETLASIMRDRHTPAAGINPNVPPEMDRIISRCLEKDARDRYPSTGEVATDLTTLAARSIRDSDRHGPDRSAVATLPSGLRGALGAAGRWLGSRPRLRFSKGERVFVAEFVDTTDSPDMGSAVRDAFEAMLAKSNLLSLVRGDALDQMVRAHADPGTIGIGFGLARRLCTRGENAGYVTGLLERSPSGLKIVAHLYMGVQKRPLVSHAALARTEDDLLMSIHEIVQEMRRSAGEDESSIQATWPPTTRSLSAFRSYAAAERLVDPAEKVPLLTRALDLDPGFVDACNLLSIAHENQGRWDLYARRAEEALRLCAGMPEQYRMKLEARCLEGKYDFEAEIDILKRHQHLYPQDTFAWASLGALYRGVFQDLVSAETMFRRAHQLGGDGVNLNLLSETLACVGKAVEIGPIVADFRARGGSEGWALSCLLQAHAALGEWRKCDEAIEQLQHQPGLEKADAAHLKLACALARGRLSEARREVHSLWRAAQEARNIWGQHIAGMWMAWLNIRQGRSPFVVQEQIAIARACFVLLPDLAALCGDASLKEPLREILAAIPGGEQKSRFLREESIFARGCLALASGRPDEATSLLKPLARDSILVRRHRLLARALEAQGFWDESVGEYEEVLRNPHIKWWWFENPAVWVLDQFRAAQIYERLGDVRRATLWYERFLADWREADLDIPEVSHARQWLTTLNHPKTEER